MLCWNVTIVWPELHANDEPAMLGYVLLKCCNRLAGACKWWGSNVWICCVKMLRSLTGDREAKQRLNDHNISQHGVTLLAQHLQAPAKRSQHFNATLLGATFCARSATLLRRVATCWVLKIELVRMPGRNIVARIWPNGYNVMQHPQMLHEKFDRFQTRANNTQNVATGLPNTRNLYPQQYWG